jgi:hypothetical protein
VENPCGSNTVLPFVNPPTDTTYEITVADPLSNVVHVTPTVTSAFPACRLTCYLDETTEHPDFVVVDLDQSTAALSYAASGTDLVG